MEEQKNILTKKLFNLKNYPQILSHGAIAQNISVIAKPNLMNVYILHKFFFKWQKLQINAYKSMFCAFAFFLVMHTYCFWLIKVQTTSVSIVKKKHPPDDFIELQGQC